MKLRDGEALRRSGNRRSPQGERGLKPIALDGETLPETVAPRKGSVG